MRFLVAGSSGFLGSRLTQQLQAEGHRVTALVRRTPTPGEARWDPYAGTLPEGLVEDHDVVVNLAGAPMVGNPFSKAWADALRRSRVTTTSVLAEAIATSDRRPAFVAGNGISWYGDHGGAPLTEHSESLGHALLTEVTRDWQAATDAASSAGARVVVLRTAPVMDAANPPLSILRRLFGLGLGGRIGSGRQYFPLVSARDWVASVVFLADSTVSGPVNLTIPEPATNADFTRALARQLHRPAPVPVPATAVRAAAGPLAPEVLGSVRAMPQQLLDAGFRFVDPDVDSVLSAALR
ncbi:MAG: TIGR01777 family oxidoreductase [Marmoricola sp.]